MTIKTKGRNGGDHPNPGSNDSQSYTGADPLPKMSSDLHRVSGGFSVRFSTGGPQGIQCEWIPSMPSPRDLRRKVDMRRYEAVRDAFIADLVKTLTPRHPGRGGIVVEIGGGAE